MNGVNKVIIVGTLGNDPVVNYTDGGICVANLSVATNETYTKKGSDEKITTTEWHKVVLWRGLAEVAEKFLRKGSKVYIEGKLKTRKYTDKNDVERYITEVYGDSLQMLDSKPSDGNQQKVNQQADNFHSAGSAQQEEDVSLQEDSDVITSDQDDDLPFLRELFAIRNNKQRGEFVDFIKNQRLPFKAVIQDIYPARSVDANAYYWGVLLKILSDELGYTHKELHDFFSIEIEYKPRKLIQSIRKFLGKPTKPNIKIKPKTEKPTPEELHIFFKWIFLLQYRPDKKGVWSLRVVSTTELDQEEFMDYCMRVRAYAMMNIGISLPLPNEIIINE